MTAAFMLLFLSISFNDENNDGVLTANKLLAQAEEPECILCDFDADPENVCAKFQIYLPFATPPGPYTVTFFGARSSCDPEVEEGGF